MTLTDNGRASSGSSTLDARWPSGGCRVNGDDGGCSLSGAPTTKTYLSQRPEPEPVMKETHALLAESMKCLSVAERAGALDDLHGVPTSSEETPHLRLERFQEMAKILEELPPESKKAFLLAKSDSINYVTSERLWIRFLRAENFFAAGAARRLVRFFEHKLELFGRDKLVQDLTIEDFSEEDLEHLGSGFCHLLNERDRSGRAVIYSIGSLAVNVPIQTRARIMLYGFLSVSNDEEIQKRGCVVVFNAVGQRTYFKERGRQIAALTASVPLKVSAVHLCYDNPILHPVIAAASFVMERKLLVRMRVHYGSNLECMYELMGFGIPRNILPIDCTGDQIAGFSSDWIKTSREREREMPREERIVAPTAKDVLMGRGKNVFLHTGNIHFRTLLQRHQARYQQASKFEKTVLVGTVLLDVKDHGGRFLAHGKDGYFEAADETSRKKIAHDFRNIRGANDVEANKAIAMSAGKRGMEQAPIVVSAHTFTGNFPTPDAASVFSAKRFKS